MPLVKKTKAKKLVKLPPHIVVVVGSPKWTKLPLITKALRKLKEEPNNFGSIRGIDLFITGTAKGAEQLAVSSAKHLGIPIIQAHPYTHLAQSRDHTYVRNHAVVKMFKPTHLLVFEDDLDSNISATFYIREFTKKDIPITVIGSKDAKRKTGKTA